VCVVFPEVGGIPCRHGDHRMTGKPATYQRRSL
jgi:hypothetical protein